MIDHLCQPNKGNMQPVIVNGRKTWRTIPVENMNDAEWADEVAYDCWIKKQRKPGKVYKFDALDIFQDEIVGICYDKIRIGEEAETFKGLLSDIKHMNSREELQVERAREVPIMGLIEASGYEVRYKKLCCPFHEDENSSLMIYENTNSWWCFGCQSGSDTIDWVMRTQKVDFVTAVRQLT